MAKKNKRPTFTTTAPVVQEFNPDYSIVKRDLIRIGVLAASFFVGLIVLSFFVQ